MAARPLIILGGGLSGLAAGIRHARFGLPTVILERHHRIGGLNSYYYRHGRLFETGLHAMTNFAPRGAKARPLNILFRQLKLSRKSFITHEQVGSEVVFSHQTLRFTNDIDLLRAEINRKFPASAAGFERLISAVRDYDPFLPRPALSSRRRLSAFLPDPLLIDMLLWPLMVYGNSQEHDMDWSQFVIMFQALFLEGFFRPAGTIKDFLDLLLAHYLSLGGEIRLEAEVSSLTAKGREIKAVQLNSGEEMAADKVVSTLGAPATMALLADSLPGRPADYHGRMSFVESIFILPAAALEALPERTCIFYNNHHRFDYCRPAELVDYGLGVINFPAGFKGLAPCDTAQLRVTHPANYRLWRQLDSGRGGKRSSAYKAAKAEAVARCQAAAGEIIGNFPENIVYQDTFTPLTIERYSAKAQGAVYGSPLKIKDGRTNYDNLFIAGTDQGYLGIVGAMLSGVTMVNQHIL